MAMEAIPELEVAGRVGSSKQSSLLDLDQEDGDGISLSSSIMNATKQ